MRQIAVSTETFSMIWAARAVGEETEDEIIQRVFSRESSDLENGGASLERAPSGLTIPSQASFASKGDGKMRWVDDIVASLKHLGGEAPLGEIYRSVRVRRQTGNRSIPRTLEAVIRRTLEDHSSDSANHRAEDLFKLVDRGIWALR